MEQITRRTALAALPAAVAATSLPAIARKQDPHAAWWAEWERLKAESVRIGDLSRTAGDATEQLSMELFDQGCQCLDRIMETPATTHEGLLVQVRLQEHYNDSEGDGTLEATLTRSMRICLERMVGAS